ncbi:transposase [Streptomyces lutosisoli]|uniref:Transposase n=1 Tax=Streptomyces lutosisoli TaxID=2665721 RepID=A0ABW2VYP5_9ACTN
MLSLNEETESLPGMGPRLCAEFIAATGGDLAVFGSAGRQATFAGPAPPTRLLGGWSTARRERWVIPLPTERVAEYATCRHQETRRAQGIRTAQLRTRLRRAGAADSMGPRRSSAVDNAVDDHVKGVSCATRCGRASRRGPPPTAGPGAGVG